MAGEKRKAPDNKIVLRLLVLMPVKGNPGWSEAEPGEEVFRIFMMHASSMPPLALA